ncbi:MAG: DUF6591 domain-containing protein [Oscillospiraceae bacterium]
MKSKMAAGLICCIFVLLCAGCEAAELSPAESPSESFAGQASPTPSVLPDPSPAQSPLGSDAPVIDVSTQTQQVVENHETTSASLNGNWPDNEFTRQLPKLSAGTVAMSLTQSRSFELLASNLSLREAKEYIDRTIEKGFDREAEMKDYTHSDIEAYTYDAKNEAGYQVCLSYSVGLLSISVKK